MKYVSRFLKSSPILILLSIGIVFCAFCLPWVFKSLMGSRYDPKQLSSMTFFVGYNIFCFLVLPLIINRFIYKEKLTNLGLRMPENKTKAILLMIAALVILMPLIIFMSGFQQFQTYYSFDNANRGKIIFYLLVFFPLYYFVEEFFFRGFLFLLLWRKIGWHSFWISDLIFTLAHMWKPPLEILFAIPAGIVLNYLVLKTKSIYPSIVVHYLLGTALFAIINS